MYLVIGNKGMQGPWAHMFFSTDVLTEQSLCYCNRAIMVILFLKLLVVMQYSPKYHLRISKIQLSPQSISLKSMFLYFQNFHHRNWLPHLCLLYCPCIKLSKLIPGYYFNSFLCSRSIRVFQSFRIQLCFKLE